MRAARTDKGVSAIGRQLDPIPLEPQGPVEGIAHPFVVLGNQQSGASALDHPARVRASPRRLGDVLPTS